jgi:hypothetical protein
MWRIIKKTFRPILALFFIVVSLLAGFPSQFLVNSISGQVADLNVVDSLYHAMQDGNVIDKNIASLLKPRVETARAADFQMQSGYYMGTGATQAITGVGFQPEFILIKSNTTAGVGVFKTSAMAATSTAFFSATADNATTQLALNSDGFTLGTLANLNTANIRYQWVAFSGSDCTSTGTFCVGQYTGNGAATQTVSTGFQPDLVIVKRTTAVAGHFRVTSHPANRASYFNTTADNTAGGLIQSFTATGFVVGSAIDNVNTGKYNFIAFKVSAGIFDEGTYTGNATDNRGITGVGFQPEFVFVKNSTSATTASRGPAMSMLENYGDGAMAIGDTTATTVNIIQAFQSDGFQIGAAARSNETGATFYYAAFAGVSAYSSSGTFVMDSGTYTGTGSNFSVTGLSFAPDLVIIKDNAASSTVFRTRLMRGDITAYTGLATTDFTLGITSLNTDGFSIGTRTIVNRSGGTYQWQAFGNAFNPYTNSGASDFAIGVLYGNGIDNRSITRTPFQPDFVVTKRNGASAAVLRTSIQSGDISVALSASAEAANQVQALNSDGFQVGTSALVNTAAGLYRWFAFATSSHFAVNTYTGNATDNRSITGVGFQPDLVWIKRSTAVNGITRPSTLAGDASQYFVSTANVADRIQTLQVDGFQIGGNQTETNTSGGTYRYAAWDGKKYAQQVYRLFTNADSADVGTALAAVNSSSTLAAAGGAFRLRVLLRVDSGNLFSSGRDFKLQFAARSGSCDTGFSGETYADVTGATVIAYNNNASPADGVSLTANVNDPTDGGRTIVNNTYEEANNFTNAQGAVNDGQDGKWDFSLIDNSAPADTGYCLRVVKSDGSLLDSYNIIPEVVTASGSSVSCSTNTASTAFGTLTTGAVSTAATNASTTMTCSGGLGCTLTVQDAGNGASPGLATSTPAYLIPSSNTTLVAGTEGYGIRATTTAAGNGGSLAVGSAYNKNGNDVGGLTIAATTLASSTTAITGREVVTTHLAAIAAITQAASYTDTITYSCVGN